MYTIHIPNEAIHVDTLAQVFHIFFHDTRLSAFDTAEISLTRDGTAMPILRYNGILTVRQQGSAVAILTSVFEEMRERWFGSTEEQLQLWRITRKQWEIFSFVFELAAKLALVLSSEQIEAEVDAARGVGRSFHLPDVCARVSRSLFGFGAGGPKLPFSGSVNGRHEVHVAQALYLDLPIPDAVLSDYRGGDEQFRHDLRWFPVLLGVPILRKSLPYGVMQSAVALFRHEQLEIDAELGARVVGALRGTPADATCVEIDDRLYAAGLLSTPDLPERYQAPVDVGVAASPVAERLRTLIGETVLKQTLTKLDSDKAGGRLSLRRHRFEVVMAKLEPGRITFDRPNRFSAAVEARDVAVLLSVLDHADGWNDPSKQVLREQFGVSLRGLNSLRRRRAIFAFCGYDEAAQSQWEALQASVRAHHFAENAASAAKKQASDAQYRGANNVVVTGVEHVDQAIADGFSEIRNFRCGAVTRYALAKPGSNEGRVLHAKNGTLAYARSRLTPLAA